MNRTQLRRFVKTRNKSGHASNLQFQIDANACGFSVDDLGTPVKFTADGFTGYLWRFDVADGRAWLIEFGGVLYLKNEPDSVDMFDLFERKGEVVNEIVEDAGKLLGV